MTREDIDDLIQARDDKVSEALKFLVAALDQAVGGMYVDDKAGFVSGCSPIKLTEVPELAEWLKA